jgi:hypothetical protein
MPLPEPPIVDFQAKCTSFGRVYKNEKCTKTCIKADSEYKKGICDKPPVKVNKRSKKVRVTRMA